MISKKMIQSTMFNDFLFSRPVIDVPVDLGDDGVVVSMSAKTLRIDARSDLVIVGLAGCFVVLFAVVVIRGLFGRMIGVGVDMLTELGGVVVVVAAIHLKVS